MLYVSTRGQAEPVDFVTACLCGLAPDGGLYMPREWPEILPAKIGESYVDVATRILRAFIGDALSDSAIHMLCQHAYGAFTDHRIVPLRQLGTDCFMMELYHGPTLAFKDIAMQFIARFYDLILARQQKRASVVCATSGDTGGAAAAAFAGADRVNVYIMHPYQRISPVQRLFMTTTGADNVHNLALDGDFDDCQAIVKGLFADKAFVQACNLSGINSINWARIAVQSVYYATAQAALGPGRRLRFIVPTGNMGDAFAAYVAARCGLLTGFETVCAINENKTLETLFTAATMERVPAVSTPSPAMDIAVPSNFERLVFSVAGDDGETVRDFYTRYAQADMAVLPDQVHSHLKRTGFSVQSVSNQETLREIRRHYEQTGQLICPHTAVAAACARTLPETGAVTVILSTAHAAKFPETVQQATGQIPSLPQNSHVLSGGGEVFERLAPDIDAVKQYMRH